MVITPPMVTGVTREPFRLMLEGRDGPLVRKVYDVLDELNARVPREMGVKLACKQGCTACCMQLASCHIREWDLVEEFLLNKATRMPRLDRRQLRRQLEKAAADYAGKYPVGTLLPPPPDLLADWLGKPCPLLLNKRCAVYPVRPLVCRVVTSTVACTSPIRGGSRQQRFDYESAAVTTLLKHAESNGVIAITPLHAHIEHLLETHPEVLKGGPRPPT